MTWASSFPTRLPTPVTLGPTELDRFVRLGTAVRRPGCSDRTRDPYHLDLGTGVASQAVGTVRVGSTHSGRGKWHV